MPLFLENGLALDELRIVICAKLLRAKSVTMSQATWLYLVDPKTVAAG
jgi:hypothetical protein